MHHTSKVRNLTVMLSALCIAAASTACSDTEREVTVQPKVSANSVDTSELENSEMVPLAELVGKTVDEAKLRLGFPDRLAGDLAKTKNVVVLAEKDITLQTQGNWTVTGWCYRNYTQTVTAEDTLTFSVVPPGSYTAGYIKGNNGYNNFPDEWAKDRGCNSNSVGMALPVLKKASK
ncbi:hypothetical protein [Tsukamurella pulmonis]|uniref:hypothetical protein n=1 Tax=Tsukamurella pulmonis TaxID=47312 RepID=UPI000AABD316|nr:hypothetical protein [Tsukamurella pulmonis]